MDKETDHITQEAVNNKPGSSKNCKKDSNSLDCVLDIAAKSYKKTFKHCDQACIRKQLKDYYENKGLEKCLKARGPRNKTGGVIAPNEDI